LVLIMTFNPNEDGVTHINVYSKGKTELGRFLTNFSYSPFVHPEDGKFNSIEGYWYWLSSKDDKLRTLSGFLAKQYGRKVKASDWLNDDKSKAKILEAIKIKIDNNPKMKKLLQENKLPLTHYYTYGDKVVNVPKAQWILGV